MAIEYFCCYHSYRRRCEKLTDQELGRLFRALMEYSETGETQELAGRESIAFDFIAEDIDRSKQAYDERCHTNAENGKRGGRPKKPNGFEENPEKPNGFFENPTEAKKAKGKGKGKGKAKGNGNGSVLETPGGRFHAPTREEVAAYCLERGNKVDPERWFDYYSSNGWRVGKNPMKDWKAAVRTWERQDGQNTPRPAYQPQKHGLDRLMEQIQRGDYDDQE